MRSSTHRIVLALVVVVLAPAAHADWKRDYDRGMRAFERQEWSDAEAAFRAALAEEPTPDARKRFQGVRTATYVPHHYAGVAAWRQGACDRAMQYWANASSSAVVADLASLAAEQRRGLADCRGRLAANAATSDTARVAPAVSASAPATMSTTSASPSPSKPTATTMPASPSTSGTTTTSSSAVTTASPARPAHSPSSDASTAASATAAITNRSPAAPDSVRPAVPNPPSATAPTRTIEHTPAGTLASAARIPPALAAAVQHYLAGDYAAILQLDPASVADGRSRAQLHLLRAASRHAAAAIAGDDAQSEAIHRDIRAARAANASLQPDAALFSPRFRALWQQAR